MAGRISPGLEALEDPGAIHLQKLHRRIKGDMMLLEKVGSLVSSARPPARGRASTHLDTGAEPLPGASQYSAAEDG